MTKTVRCPDCDKMGELEPISVIVPDDAVVGDILECPNCGAELELISIDPLQVALIEVEK